MAAATAAAATHLYLSRATVWPPPYAEKGCWMRQVAVSEPLVQTFLDHEVLQAFQWNHHEGSTLGHQGSL